MSPPPFRNLAKRIIICSTLLPLIALSQVKIKEKVEIKQKQSVTGTASADFRVECTFSGPIDPNRPHFIYARGSCSTTADAQLPGSLSLPTYAGGYLAGYRFTVPAGGGGNFRFTIYLGADILQDISFPVSAPFGATLVSEQSEYFYSGFTIETEPSIVYGLSSGLSFEPQWSEEPCVTTIWHGVMPVSLGIASGGEFGQFIDANGQPAGTSVTTTGGGIGGFRFVADGIDPGENNGKVVIQAAGGGVTAIDTIEIISLTALHHFAISTEVNPILFSQSSKVFIQARTLYDDEYIAQSDFDVTLSVRPVGGIIEQSGQQLTIAQKRSTHAIQRAANPLIQSSTYGSFSVDDQTPVAETITVHYSVAKAGRVKYIADGERLKQQDFTEVVLKVEKTTDPAKRGERTVLIDNSACVLVTVNRATLSPGDTITLRLQRQNPDGTVTEFQDDPSFDVFLFGDVEERGKLVSGTDSATALSNVKRPILYVAPRTMEADSITVSFRALLYSPGGEETSNPVERDEVLLMKIGQVTMQSAKTTRRESLLSARGKKLALACPLAMLAVKKKNDCSMPIVICSSAQLEAQTFSPNNTRVWSEGETFIGKDASGDPLEVQIEACAENPKQVDLSGRLGLTLIMPRIPLHGDIRHSFIPLSDKQISACLDPPTQRWNFTVDNVSVPMFMSVCPNRVDFKEFLGDGTDQGLLRIQIPNRGTYENVLRDLEYWIEGSYSLKNKNRRPQYYFPVGILAHENDHYVKNYYALKWSFDDAFAKIRQINNFTLDKYPCPTDAVEGVKLSVNVEFTSAFGVAQSIRKQADERLEEENADKAASQFYQDMKDRIQTWASTQLWF